MTAAPDTDARTSCGHPWCLAHRCIRDDEETDPMTDQPSAFARAVAAAIGVPAHEIDQLGIGPQTTRADIERILAEATAQSAAATARADQLSATLRDRGDENAR